MVFYPLDALRISARALYDYEARSDKELTFSRGDFLQVITKTPDNNWWDGFHRKKRGFIPVAYVEVTELKPSPSPSPVSFTEQAVAADTMQAAGTTLPVPAPPQRISSIPLTDVEAAAKVSEAPREPVIPEEVSNERPTAYVISEDTVTSPPMEFSPPPQPHLLSLEREENTGDTVPEGMSSSAKPKGSVKSLTKQFQEPDVTATKILVEPVQSSSHRRQLSDHYHKNAPGDAQEPLNVPSRSASIGNKVSFLSSAFQSKSPTSPAPPPPLKPRPTPTPLSSSAPGPTSDVFQPITYGAAVPSISPLQRAAHQGQHLGQKPPISSRKISAGKGTKNVSKLKKKDSVRDKERDKASKPPPTPKPGFGASSAEIQAELQARAHKRKKSEDFK